MHFDILHIPWAEKIEDMMTRRAWRGKGAEVNKYWLAHRVARTRATSPGSGSGLHAAPEFTHAQVLY
jgi:hypothetical protein